MTHRAASLCLIALSACLLSSAQAQQPKPARQAKPAAESASVPQKKIVDLPSSKLLFTPLPGDPQSVGSLPVSMTVSPDGNYLAILDDGFGWSANKGYQGIGVLDLRTNSMQFYPDSRLGQRAHQTYFLGLAFSPDGTHLYASISSITDPLAKDANATGNGIAVYRFADGKVSPERFIPLEPVLLPSDKRTADIMKSAPKGTAVPYPAGLAVVPSPQGERLLVADNLSDDAVLLDTQTGRVIHRYDLSISRDVPAAYPYAVVANKAGTRAWCSLWNGSRVAELDLNTGEIVRWILLRAPRTLDAAGSHPTALLLSPDEQELFVTLSNTDEVAVVRTQNGAVASYLSTRMQGAIGGMYPNALAQSADGKRLFVANASADAVAVFGRASEHSTPAFRLLGLVPTEWYPTALAVAGNDLLIASGKSQGTGPNSAILPKSAGRGGHPYAPSLLHGSVARIAIAQAERDLPSLTREVRDSNLMNGRGHRIPFASSVCRSTGKRGCNPIKHVIYVIKENRTYDQIFGDLGVGNGDPSLTMYGDQITPNEHKLALQFGVLDNFYDSGEISGSGHVWSTAAITSDYTEKTWPIGYRGRERTYDYEGSVADESPLEQGIPDVNEPGTGYLWTNAARHGLTYRHYGEYVSTSWCDDQQMSSPQEGTPLPHGQHCARKFIEKGEALPSYLGDPHGSPSPWPWPVPIIARNKPMKPELRGHFDPRSADFRMEYPDQFRADEFLNEFAGFIRDRQAGKDTMPQLIVLRLPNDHTSGTRPGKATPSAAVADNDLALGRVVDAISHSAYWNDTAILALEDDAQDGADHVDAHRSIALVISKYAPRSSAPLVHHEFYTTVNMIHTLEMLLGLPPMNNNDAQAPVMAPLFSGNGDQPAFTADYRNRDNGLLYATNSDKAPGAKASLDMDFTHADNVDTEALNRILWQDAKGDVPMPAPKHTVITAQ